jgi:hypothetical protein
MLESFVSTQKSSVMNKLKKVLYYYYIIKFIIIIFIIIKIKKINNKIQKFIISLY